MHAASLSSCTTFFINMLCRRLCPHLMERQIRHQVKPVDDGVVVLNVA
jgi:hypothetical protein